MAARRTLTRWPVVRLLAARLMLRDTPPSPRVRRMLVGSSLVMLGCALPLWLGVHQLWLVAVLGVASMVGLAAICLRLFNPAMAVSVVGVALACASLMTALSVTTGFQLEITRALARLNGHVLLTKYGLDFFEYEQVADRWKAEPEVIAASPFAYSMVAVVPEPAGDGEDVAVEVLDESSGDEPPSAGPAIVVGKGIDPRRAAELEGFGEILGRGDPSVLRPGDTRHLPGIVLGRGLAARLGVEVGDRVRVVVPTEVGGEAGPPRYAVFDLLDTLSTGTSEVDRNMALMHLSAGQSLFFREGRVTGIEFELSDPELAEVVAARMTAELPQVYRVSTWRETNSPMLIGLEQIRATLSLVLGLMVVVAASSLIASLLLLVRRKRHDVAVMMAVGGARSLVFWVFEAVGLLAGGVGAVLGLALGGLYCLVIDTFRYPLGSDIYPVDHLPVVVQAVDALGPALAAVGLCGLASGPVAMLAARVRVVASLQR
ncbi:MAG: ABC transporter permease [Myxococcales bacterium]|nr:ABC transporter permease [Myxococcales bacterium]MCB9716352.1 ABC transporter permease [Myxococcales bacterium]